MMEITVKVCRSDKWVHDERLRTGNNIPRRVDLAVEVTRLSEPIRRALLQHGDGHYGPLGGFNFTSDGVLNASGCQGNEPFIVDSEQPTQGEVEQAILAAMERIAARKEKINLALESRKQKEKDLAVSSARLLLVTENTVGELDDLRLENKELKDSRSLLCRTLSEVPDDVLLSVISQWATANAQLPESLQIEIEAASPIWILGKNSQSALRARRAAA
jgi:hypothetical protein